MLNVGLNARPAQDAESQQVTESHILSFVLAVMNPFLQISATQRILEVGSRK